MYRRFLAAAPALAFAIVTIAIALYPRSAHGQQAAVYCPTPANNCGFASPPPGPYPTFPPIFPLPTDANGLPVFTLPSPSPAGYPSYAPITGVNSTGSATKIQCDQYAASAAAGASAGTMLLMTPGPSNQKIHICHLRYMSTAASGNNAVKFGWSTVAASCTTPNYVSPAYPAPITSPFPIFDLQNTYGGTVYDDPGAFAGCLNNAGTTPTTWWEVWYTWLPSGV